jgi:hypothetical protein
MDINKSNFPTTDNRDFTRSSRNWSVSYEGSEPQIWENLSLYLESWPESPPVVPGVNTRVFQSGFLKYHWFVIIKERKQTFLHLEFWYDWNTVIDPDLRLN